MTKTMTNNAIELSPLSLYGANHCSRWGKAALSTPCPRYARATFIASLRLLPLRHHPMNVIEIMSIHYTVHRAPGHIWLSPSPGNSTMRLDILNRDGNRLTGFASVAVVMSIGDCTGLSRRHVPRISRQDARRRVATDSLTLDTLAKIKS
jgi:hypothetical protein